MKGISTEEKSHIESNRRFAEHKHRFSWKIALKSRSLRGLVTAMFCSQWVQYFFIAWMPVYLQEGRHFSENEAKIITSNFFIVGIIGVVLAGFTSDRLVKRKGLRFARRFLGMFPLGVVAALFLVAAATSSNTIVVISLYIGQLFYSFTPVVSFSTCVDIGGDRVGTVAGTMNFCGQIGAFFLAIVFGKIVDITDSFNAPLIVIALVLFIGSLCWLFVDASKQINVENSNNDFIYDSSG